MSKYDVVVIGAGAAGLTAGALLAKHGKKVLVMDRDKHLGDGEWQCRSRDIV